MSSIELWLWWWQWMWWLTFVLVQYITFVRSTLWWLTFVRSKLTHFWTVNMRKILKRMIAKTELITTTIRKQTKAPGINWFNRNTVDIDENLWRHAFQIWTSREQTAQRDDSLGWFWSSSLLPEINWLVLFCFAFWHQNSNLKFWASLFLLIVGLKIPPW